MSGLCSQHKHYEAVCNLCQSSIDRGDIITINRLCDLDRLVAEHVFGWVDLRYFGDDEWYGHAPEDKDAPEDDLMLVPCVSYSMDGAWELQEFICSSTSLEKIGFQVDNVGIAPNHYRCQIGWGDDAISVFAEAPTAPIAICLAALAVKGVKVVLGDEVVRSLE